jgi:REP element-mobilizing transposase RayT
MTSGQEFVVFDRLLDIARKGPLYLRQPDIADMIVDAIHYCGERGDYALHAYVVMANHIHLLVTPSVPVSKLTQSLKRFTARQANRILHRTGETFWAQESYDRVVRQGPEFNRIVRYIEFNPVKAGLVTTPERFPYSSAKAIENRPQATSPPYT